MNTEIKGKEVNKLIFRHELSDYANYLPSYDEGSLEKVDQIFTLMKDIGSVDDLDDVKIIWIHTMQSKPYWYKLVTVENPKYEYRAIALNGKTIFASNGLKETEKWESRNIAELLDWVIVALRRSLRLLQSGQYEKYVNRRLPLDLRTGVIKRNILWELFPEWRDDFYQDFSASERQKFLHYAKREIVSSPKRIPSMTANDFYKFCSIGYKANGYDGINLSPKDQYLKHADGRDDGLCDIDPDSPAAFLDWLKDKSHFGGHPWEVCRGGNSTHIDLLPVFGEEGYYLYLRGSSINRTIETLKFYNALNDSNVPVVLSDIALLRDRITGDENVGIVPRTVFPRYCHSMFPEGNVIDFIHLPDEKKREVSKHCMWQTEPKVKLKMV